MEYFMENNVSNTIWRKPLIIVVAITIVVLGAACLFMVIPKTKVATSGNLRVEYTPDRDEFEFSSHLFPIKVIAPSGVDRVVLFYGGKKGFQQRDLVATPVDTTWYVTSLTMPEKGVRIYYYFQVWDWAGNQVTLPKKASPNYTSEYNYFKIRSEGHPWAWALYLHILLMFFALLLFVHILYDAFYILNGGHRTPRIMYMTTHAVVCFFITGFPLGWLIEKQVLGNYWEGIPFGWDITDSKTLFIFIFWMIPLILWWTKKIGEKAFAKWALAGALFTIAMFSIPHSL
jgi:hypothetical protein